MEAITSIFVFFLGWVFVLSVYGYFVLKEKHKILDYLLFQFFTWQQLSLILV